MLMIPELMWTAPELLRSLDKEGRVTKATQEADIYAGAIILKEIFLRNGPYTEQDYMMPEGMWHIFIINHNALM